MGQETIKRFEAMHEYIAKHVRFNEVKPGSQAVYPKVKVDGVVLDWGNVEVTGYDDEVIELNAELYDKEMGYDTFSFANPDTKDVILKLGEAFEAAGYPTEHSEIVRVLREFQANYVPPVKIVDH